MPFDLDVTLCCGQVFRWSKLGDWWFGVVGDKAFRIRQVENALEFAGVDEDFVARYFGLDEDLQGICESAAKDAYAKAAFRRFWGLRLVRQDVWECLASYICATYKSIAAIKRMLNCLAEKFGEKKVFDGKDFFAFPSADALAKSTEKALAACGLGYRAKYLLETSKLVVSKQFELENLARLPYLQARSALCMLPGVGLKVADCVLLFSVGRLEAFPVDVWVRRVMLNHYAKELPAELAAKLAKQESLSNTGYVKLSEFARGYFGEYAGYVQEYLYHYERMHVC